MAHCVRVIVSSLLPFPPPEKFYQDVDFGLFSRLDSALHCTYNVNMDLLRFEWDEGKNRRNQEIHGISFEEARTVFFDDNAVEFYDDKHSGWEDRFLLRC